MGKRNTTTMTDLFSAQAALLDAADDSPAERHALRGRNRILNAMTPKQKQRATIIAVTVERLCR